MGSDQISEITSFLELAGEAPAATVGSKFGVKREQLEASGFVFGPQEENGQFNVLAPSIAFEVGAAGGAPAAASNRGIKKASPHSSGKGAKHRSGKRAEAGFEVLA